MNTQHCPIKITPVCKCAHSWPLLPLLPRTQACLEAVKGAGNQGYIARLTTSQQQGRFLWIKVEGTDPMTSLNPLEFEQRRDGTWVLRHYRLKAGEDVNHTNGAIAGTGPQVSAVAHIQEHMAGLRLLPDAIYIQGVPLLGWFEEHVLQQAAAQHEVGSGEVSLCQCVPECMDEAYIL